jgi:hypothetical protein
MEEDKMLDVDCSPEENYEKFIALFKNNSQIEYRIRESFADPIERSVYWKKGIDEEISYTLDFEEVYKWNEEYFVTDPKACIRNYMLWVRIRF